MHVIYFLPFNEKYFLVQLFFSFFLYVLRSMKEGEVVVCFKNVVLDCNFTYLHKFN